MSEQPKPNIAISLFTIHQVITRGLKVSIENGQTFSIQGFPKTETKEGFLNYLRALVSVLDSHHLVEDELAFPYFKNKLPEMPVDLLGFQHQQIIPYFEQITRGIDHLDKPEQVEIGFRDINRALYKINELWHPHIKIEEEHMAISKLESMLPVDEHLRLIKEYAEYSQQHSGPPYLTIPFILYNLPVPARQALARGMPVEVTEQLVPVTWKPQWQSMQPFLLE